MRGQSTPLKNAVAWWDGRGNIHIAATVNGKRIVSTVTANLGNTRRNPIRFTKSSKPGR